MCDHITQGPTQVLFEFDIDSLTQNLEPTRQSSESEQSNEQCIPFSLDNSLFSKIPSHTNNNANMTGNSEQEEQKMSSNIMAEETQQIIPQQIDIGQQINFSAENSQQSNLFSSPSTTSSESQQISQVNVDSITQAFMEYNQNKQNPLQQSIQDLEYQLWQLQQNSIYNEKNGLQKEIYKKIKTNKVGSTSQCCSICFQNFEMGEKIKVLPCKHIFHINCIKPWLKKNSQCPNCRFDLQKHFCSSSSCSNNKKQKNNSSQQQQQIQEEEQQQQL